MHTLATTTTYTAINETEFINFCQNVIYFNVCSISFLLRFSFQQLCRFFAYHNGFTVCYFRHALQNDLLLKLFLFVKYCLVNWLV